MFVNCVLHCFINFIKSVVKGGDAGDSTGGQDVIEIIAEDFVEVCPFSISEVVPGSVNAFNC